MGSTHHGTHAFCLRIQFGMPQYTTRKDGHLLWHHLKANNTILPMADLTRIKATIPREEGGPTKSVQKWEDFLILESLPVLYSHAIPQ